MFRPESSIADNQDAPSAVRNYLARHRECQWDAHDLALTLRLPEVEVHAALEALTIEDGLLP